MFYCLKPNIFHVFLHKTCKNVAKTQLSYLTRDIFYFEIWCLCDRASLTQ